MLLSSNNLQTQANNEQCPVRKILTFNTSLRDLPLSDGLPENRILRREALIQELRRLDADVVCLQEVWIGQDVERITSELFDVYSHTYSKIHNPGRFGGNVPSQSGPSMAPCNYHDAMNFAKCAMRNKCIKKKYTDGQLYFCLNIHCNIEYKRLSQKCMTCVTSCSSRTFKLKKIYRNCIGNGLPAINMRTLNEPGILLLSKRPLLNAKYTDFHPYTKEFIERGYIEADTYDFGKVVCTHTTNNMEDYFEIELSRMGAFSNYVEQGHSERTELIETFGNSYPIIIAGDFNTGDSFGPLINSDLPQEFRYLARYFDVTPVKTCTLCWPHENIYNTLSKATLNTVVDHVFYKGHKVVAMSRVITPEYAVLFDTLPLSDHYGVMAVFSMC